MIDLEARMAEVMAFHKFATVVARWMVAIGFIAAGANHFRSPAFYERIVPPHFPSPKWLVIISGVAEIAGGAGVLIPRLRRSAGVGLIALLIAVFPANIYMAVAPEHAGLGFPKWALWLRLPMQLVMIAIVAWVCFAGATRNRQDALKP